MPLRTTLVLLCLCAPALMSCREQPDPPEVAVPEAPTRGGEGSQIDLRPLSAGQVDDVDLAGELACSFADAVGGTLLLARADVMPDGVVSAALNNNGYVETVGNGQAGGFNDLLDGITLAGKGLTVELERGEPQPTGNEATQHAATLKVMRADGAERSYDGTLVCGP